MPMSSVTSVILLSWSLVVVFIFYFLLGVLIVLSTFFFCNDFKGNAARLNVLL